MFNHFKSAIMSLALVLTLSACGTAQQGAETSEVAAEPEQPAVVETQMVNTTFGEVEIPAHPERVAAIRLSGNGACSWCQTDWWRPISNEQSLSGRSHGWS